MNLAVLRHECLLQGTVVLPKGIDDVERFFEDCLWKYGTGDTGLHEELEIATDENELAEQDVANVPLEFVIKITLATSLTPAEAGTRSSTLGTMFAQHVAAQGFMLTDYLVSYRQLMALPGVDAGLDPEHALELADKVR